MSIHTIEVAEPWFSHIKSGEKTVEGKKATPKWMVIKAGDTIKFVNPAGDEVYKIVKDVRHYLPGGNDPLDNYLAFEGIRNCVPGITSLEKARDVYLQYYSIDDIAEYGMLAIRLM